MSLKVNCALAIIPNADGVSGDWYGYEGAIVPEGLNDERCKSLLADGLLAEVKDEKDEKPATRGRKADES